MMMVGMPTAKWMELLKKLYKVFCQKWPVVLLLSFTQYRTQVFIAYTYVMEILNHQVFCTGCVPTNLGLKFSV